ncbi:MAG TPA: type VI secretion system tip protein TssI/VgrG [Polyangiaceae bacterium]|jgi:type VI secretion system secreted protein VgrG
MLEKAAAVLRTSAFVSEAIAEFREQHQLNCPPSVEVEVWLEDSLAMDKVVGAPAELSYGAPSGDLRSFRGVIEAIELSATLAPEPEQLFLVYRLRIVSALALLERSVGSEIFQNQTVKEVVSAVLEAHGFTPTQQTWQLSGTYPPREYCVRYQESALAFVNRLLESEGIAYCVEPHPDADDQEMIVLFDRSAAAPACDGPPSLPIRDASRLEDDGEAVYGFEDCSAVRPGSAVLRDFDFEHPTLDLTATASGDAYTDLEVYDYPGGYVDPKDGARLAQVRLEEFSADSAVRVIETDSMHLRVGRKLVIESESGKSEWFVIAIDQGMDPKEEEEQYNHFDCTARLIPLKVPYRPARVTPKPVIYGPQTATVMAPKGAQAEEIHTDAHGRCTVRFHWDRSDLAFEKSSCWIRVGQLQTSGSLALPRVGWEVLVEFLEGDPDRPLVTGRLYNGIYMPPYALPEGRTRTALRTSSTPGGGGSNEIRLEDKAGAEEIAISSQYNTKLATANNRDRKINNDQTLVVGNNTDVSVGANSKVEIGSGWSHTTNNQTWTVGGNRKLEVNAVYGLTTGAATMTVGGNQTEMIGDPLAGVIATVTAAVTVIAAAKAEHVLAHVEGAVQGKIDQALGPVHALTAQAGELGGAAEAAAGGSLSAALSLGPAAAALPGAGALAGSIGGPPAAATSAPGGGEAAGDIAVSGAVGAVVGKAVGSAIARGKDLTAAAFGKGQGGGGSGGGSSSTKNTAGPVGDVGGVSAADAATGPGHSQYKIGGPHTETVGSLRMTGALNAINLNVAVARTETVGAAHLEATLKDRAESVEGVKIETAVGLIVVSLADDTETVKAARSNLVGGAVLEKVKGTYSVTDSVAATFAGAMHKLSANTKITLKVGASSLVIDGGGVTIESPMVMLTGATITHTKNVADG